MQRLLLLEKAQDLLAQVVMKAVQQEFHHYYGAENWFPALVKEPVLVDPEVWN